MVSAYPGLFYPGQVYPGQVDGQTDPPSGGTVWPSFKLTVDGRWIRRDRRVLVWPDSSPLGYDLYDGASGTDIYDFASGTDIYDFQWPFPASVLNIDGNGTVDILDGDGTIADLTDGNG